MLHPRHILIVLGVLLLIVGGWWSWRASQPELSDEQQVAAVIEDLRHAVQNRNSGRITSYLAEDFSWNGRSKSELNSLMRGSFFQWQDVQPNVMGLQVSVTGTTATARGKYSLAYRPRRSRPEVRLGEFELLLEKRDGEWLITSADGRETTGN